MKSVYLALLLFLLASAPLLLNGQLMNLNPIYSTPYYTGTPVAITMLGSYLFLGGGYYDLSVVDFSNPDHPETITVYDIPDITGSIISFQVYGEYIYAFARYNFAYIINVSDPCRPQLVNTIAYTQLRSQTQKNNFLFISSVDFPLHCFDVSNPANPQLICSLTGIDSSYCMGFVEDHLLMSQADTSVRLINISDPANLIDEGLLSLEADETYIGADGNVFYCQANEFVNIYSLGESNVPEYISQIQVGNSEFNLYINQFFGLNHRICIRYGEEFAGYSSSGFRVYDCTDPTQPKMIYDNNDYGLARYYEAGDDFIIRGYGTNLSLLHLTEENTLVPYGRVDQGELTCIEGNEDILFLAQGNTLKILRLQSTAHPDLIGELNLPTSTRLMKYYNGYLYVFYYFWDSDQYIYYGQSLMVINVSDPHNPIITYDESSDLWISAIEIVNETLYLFGDGIQVFSISDPASPVFMYNDPLFAANCVKIFKDKYLIVGKTGPGNLNHVQVYDIENLEQPSLIWQETMTDPIYDIEVLGDYAYVVGNFYDLKVISLADISNSVVLSHLNLGVANQQISFLGKVAILDGPSTYTILDLHNPTQPQVFAQNSLSSYGSYCYGNMAYSINAQCLNVYDLSPILAAMQTPEPLMIKQPELNCYPNPFNPSMNIEFSLYASKNLSLHIYNLKGQKVRQWAQQNYSKGYHILIWDGKDDQGAALPSGVYLLKLSGDGLSDCRKISLVK